MPRTRDATTVYGVWMVLLLAAAAGCQRKDAAAPIAQPPFAPDATIKDLMLNVVDTTCDGRVLISQSSWKRLFRPHL